jgi:glycosyltransferase involved in cell wall biosynthesis
MASPRPRILFVSPIAPHPADIGVKIRILNMLDSVAMVGAVDFVGYSIDPTPDNFPTQAMLSDIAARCRTVRICRHPAWRGVGSRETLKIIKRYLLSSTPVLYGNFPREPLLAMAGAMAEEADLIWAERLYTAHCLRRHGAKMIVDVDDLDSVKSQRQLQIDPRLGSFLRWCEKKQISKLAWEERKAAQRFSRLVVCSEQDRDFWPADDRERVWVAPNGADERLFDYPRGGKAANRLIFVGAMSYAPNEDAASYFCAEILPLVAKEIPDISFWIVGKSPSDAVRQLHDGRRVMVVADVPDIAPYVQEASLSVVPLRVGGGTRLKILESLALGTPVVSTTIGAEGLNLKDGQDLVLSDAPDDFANAVVNLLRQPDRYTMISETGFRTIRMKYAWAEIRCGKY